jgi:hypothetical protein
VTFSTTTAIIKVGPTSSNAGDTAIAHVYIGPQTAPPPAYSIPEIPGMGVGVKDKVSGSCPSGYSESFNDSTKCFLLLPSTFADRDRDGQTTTDCDDTDPSIISGVYTTKGCSGGQYRLCSNGSWGSCSGSTLCEAGSGGTCYYVNPTTGSNSNAGTYASPFADLRKVSSDYAGAVTLTAGDVIYLVGTGTITATQDVSGTPAAFYSYRQGASGNPIKLKQYPGSTVTISVSNGNGIYIIYPGRYWLVEGMRVTNNSTDKSPIRMGSARDTELRLNYIYDSSGNGSENSAGIYHTVTWDGAQQESINIHNNYIKNMRWNNISSRSNVSSILLMNSDIQGNNSLVDIKNNRAWDTSEDLATSSTCFKRKHGMQSSASGTISDAIEISDNFCIGGYYAIDIGGGGTDAQRNIATGVTGFANINGELAQTLARTRFRYNSSIDSGSFMTIAQFIDNLTDNVDINSNIFMSNGATYSGGAGVNVVCWGSTYCTNSAQVYNSNIYLSNSNCYGGSNLRYSWFHSNGGLSSGTFAQFKTSSGDDETTSYETDPGIDSYYRATSENCSNKGWLALLESEESSPSPSPSGVISSRPGEFAPTKMRKDNRTRAQIDSGAEMPIRRNYKLGGQR